MTYFVLMRRRGPQWRDDLPMEKQAQWPEHAAFMDALVDRGFVVLGGPLADEKRVVLVIESPSEEEVRTTLAADPWSESHLVIESIDRWTIRLNGR